MDLCILNAVLAKVQAHFDHLSKTAASAETETHKLVLYIFLNNYLNVYCNMYI